MGGEVGEEQEGPFWTCRCPLSGSLQWCDWPAWGKATAADATAVVSRSGSVVAVAASAVNIDAYADADAEPDAPGLALLLTQAVLKEPGNCCTHRQPVRPVPGPRSAMVQALGGAGAGPVADAAVLLWRVSQSALAMTCPEAWIGQLG